MEPLTLLRAAKQAQIWIRRDGDTLHVSAPNDQHFMVAELAAHKLDILTSWWSWEAQCLLEKIADDGIRQDLKDVFEEIAAIQEYEQNRDRETAESIAFGALVTELEWRGLNTLNVHETTDRR